MTEANSWAKECHDVVYNIAFMYFTAKMHMYI